VHGPARRESGLRVYCHSFLGPTICDVHSVSLPRRPASGICRLALVLTAAAPAFAQQPPPVLPLTQLEERGPAADLDARAFTMTFAQPVPIKDLLLLLVRGTSLSVVPDAAITGSFIGELKNVTVRQALDSILPSLALDYSVQGGVIRVFPRRRVTRIFDVNYLGGERTATSRVGVGAADQGAATTASVSTGIAGDVFADLTKGIQTLLSEGGTFNVDRKAGLIQVTDFPAQIDRVAAYLDAVDARMHRQVEIEAQIVEVELTDPDAGGIDWQRVAAALGGPPGTVVPPRPLLTGLRVTNVDRLVAVLAAQGRVATLQRARLATLNNEPAIVRSDTLTLSVTPQITSDGVVMLNVTPVLKAPAPAEADALGRVADGESLMISGYSRNREVRARTGGWFGRPIVMNRRVELVILLTPKVL
jgi:hypothetical protein